MTPLEALLIEPDRDAADALAACFTRAFPGRRVVHVSSVAGLEQTPLRDTTIALCADASPGQDAADAIDHLLERKPTLPVVALLDEARPDRLAALLARGAVDFAPRRGWSPHTVEFMISTCLGVARLQRDTIRMHAGLTRSLAELVQRNRQLAETADRLEVMASTDPLTRLNNRWWLKQRLDSTFAVAARYGSDLSCMMIDLDEFKAVNDSFGHLHGDRVLELTGEMIAREIRASDAAARYGGDEFIILMPRASADTAISLAHRLLRGFHRKVRAAAGLNDACSMCIGLACLSVSRPGAAETLIRHADIALYAAKRAGAGEIRICGPDGASAVDTRAFAA